MTLSGSLTPQPKASSRTDDEMKKDGGKRRVDLLDPAWLLGTADVLEFGANKYAAHKWAEGMDWSRVYGALLRHMLAWWSGEEIDPETGLSHMYHASCCIMFLSRYATDPKYAEYDDRPKVLNAGAN